jgi:hypothetical protein
MKGYDKPILSSVKHKYINRVASDVDNTAVVSPSSEVSDTNVKSGGGYVNNQTIDLVRDKTFSPASPASPSGSSDCDHNISVDLMN